MIGRLNTTAMDCPVPIDTARFYRRLLGSRLLDDSDAHPTFRVYADPIGRPFCLVLE